MSRIGSAFEKLRLDNKVGVIGYLTVGFPDVKATVDLVRAMVAGGVDAVELGVPFSDPLADGATIQRAAYHALQQGVTLQTCLELTRELRNGGITVPVLLMGYYNPFFSYGIERLCRDCASYGVDGFIVPDLPLDEAEELLRACEANGLDLIQMLAPTSTDERIASVAAKASGFIYCVSLTGVTGARTEMSSSLPDFIARIRKHTDLPLAVGFGISTKEHVENVGKLAEAAVIGSAIVSVVEKSDAATRVSALEKFIRDLRN